MRTHAAAKVDRILFASLVDGFDHFGGGGVVDPGVGAATVDLERHVGQENGAFRAHGCVAPVLLTLVVGVQCESVDNSVLIAPPGIFVEAVLHTGWAWCIGVWWYRQFFRTHYQTLTLPVPTSLQRELGVEANKVVN